MKKLITTPMLYSTRVLMASRPLMPTSCFLGAERKFVRRRTLKQARSR